jgi:hypothetical protein
VQGTFWGGGFLEEAALMWRRGSWPASTQITRKSVTSHFPTTTLSSWDPVGPAADALTGPAQLWSGRPWPRQLGFHFYFRGMTSYTRPYRSPHPSFLSKWHTRFFCLDFGKNMEPHRVRNRRRSRVSPVHPKGPGGEDCGPGLHLSSSSAGYWSAWLWTLS